MGDFYSANHDAAQAALTREAKAKIIVIFSIALIFSVMNTTAFIIAVPDIARAFSLLPSQASWVVTGYALVYSVGIVCYGKLADIYPIRSLLIAGLILFAAGSFVGFFAPNYMMIVVARMIQAVGSASIMALAFIVPFRYFPDRQGTVMGIFSSTMAFASGVGPVFGGFIAGSIGWPYLFLISGLILLVIPLASLLIPKEAKKDGRVDFPGALLIIGALVALIQSITGFDWRFFVVSVTLLGLFVWHIGKGKYPFVSPQVFKSAAYRNGMLVSFVWGFASFCMFFMLPLFLSKIEHLHASMIGLVILPGAMSAALVGRIAGKLADRSGTFSTIYLAFALQIFGYFLLSTLVGGVHAWVIAILFVMINTAFPFFQTAMVVLISRALPENQIGIGLGVFNLSNFLTGAFGGAVIGKILDHATAEWEINPFALGIGDAVIFSNLYLALTVLLLLNGAFFYFKFVRPQTVGKSKTSAVKDEL